MVAHSNGKGTPVSVNTGKPRVPTASSNVQFSKPTVPKAAVSIKRSNTLHR